jgi:energy-coupling factor transport system substrate-specific component
VSGAEAGGKKAGLWVLSIIIGVLFAAFFIYIAYDIVSKGLGNWSEWIISKPFIALGRDFWFAVSGVLWVVGTALFFMEMFGYTITRQLKIAKNNVKWDAVDVAVAALSAAIYGGSLAATGGLPIIPGFTWLRPGNSLAPLFGILFGIPGALGTSIGNFIADALTGYLSIGSIGGFIGNFIIAYIPYKLMTDHSFRTPRSIIEYYIWGAVVSSVYCSLYISWWLDALEPVIGLPRLLVWGWFAPWVIFNNAIVTSTITPILGYLLYPPIKMRGLYWKDRVA